MAGWFWAAIRIAFIARYALTDVAMLKLIGTRIVGATISQGICESLVAITIALPTSNSRSGSFWICCCSDDCKSDPKRSDRA
jgi:hypothetical protein